MYRCFTVFSKVTHVRRKREAWVREAWRRVDLGSGVFIANFEHIVHLVLVFLLLTLNM